MREPIRTYASVFTYICISLHVRTHKPIRIYVIVSASSENIYARGLLCMSCFSYLCVCFQIDSDRMNQLKGIIYAAVSSATFGLAPFFSISLLAVGFSSFEVLTYRWGVATVVLLLFGFLAGCNFRLGAKEFMTVFGLSLFRAVTSFSLVIAYQNIASGVASIIHFMYPLAVAVVMIVFCREKKSVVTFTAILLSLIGASLLSSGNIEFSGGDTGVGLVAACISVFSQAIL